MSNGDIGREEIAHAEDELMHGLIEEARRGNRELARDLLWQFHVYIECGESPPPHLLQYLSECFHRMLDEGVPPGEALHIEGSTPAAGVQDQRVRDKAIAQMVLMRAGNDPHKGAVEHARDWVVQETGFSCTQVEHAYEKYRGELLTFNAAYGAWPLITRPLRE